MCGIAGISWGDTELIGRMTQALTHRGPDQCGVHVDEHVALGHRRLSIIDLSNDGREPMPNEDGTVWLTFNGEIYGYRELRRTLEARGHRFRSRTDAEVVIHAWEEHGPACVEHLDGMFAFAIWDARRREIFLARDRLGIKPLYYATIGDRLAFASEIKALLQVDSLDAAIDPQSVYRYVGYEFIPAPNTIFRDVRKLPPGSTLSFRDGAADVRPYWDLQLAPVRRSAAEHAEVLRDALEAAVQRQLDADVPLGVFLSGGLDSSALVAFMSRSGIAPLRTFSLGYDDASFSELDHARTVSRAFDTEHHELIIDPVTPEVLEETIWHLDEPMTDLSTVPLYLLCKSVREHVKVCLSGEGGDEVLVGYDRFKASKADACYAILPAWLRRGVIGPAVARLADRPQKKGLVNVLKRFIEGGLLPEEGGHMRWQYFGSPDLDRRLFAGACREAVEADRFAPMRPHLDRCRGLGRLDREIYIDTRFFLPESPLMKVDKMSMAHGLEVRVPFLDHSFVEACATIPASLKLRGFTTKAIFRRAMRGVLPERILTRGKQGYSLPIKNWLRNELREYMIDTIDASPLIDEHFDPDGVRGLIDEHVASRANNNHVLWALINLSIWHRRFVEERSLYTAEQPIVPQQTAV